MNVARTSLKTKLTEQMANQLTEIVVDAVLTVRKNDNIDLHMVEIMHMNHKLGTETKLIKGLVLDHGGRHPEMPKSLENCWILNCNSSLEYEKTEVHSQFVYSNPEQREKLIASERNFTDDQCRKVIELKRKVCEGTNKSFVLINQKGIDPLSLDMLAKEGILALRRAKKRNMERLILAAGGNAVHSFDDVTEKDLGYAEKVYEQSLGEEKYTFVEGVTNPFSCTILIKGPNDYSIAQVKDAIRDGLRCVKNVFDDQSIVPGAGAFECNCHDFLLDYARDNVVGKAFLGVKAFAEALLVIPKAICENAGIDSQESILKAIKASREAKSPMGIDINTGDAINPILQGIADNYCVKKSFLNLGPVLVQQLLLVDEVMRAGKQMRKGDE
jgi:T-complex protein 1 subunit zeta